MKINSAAIFYICVIASAARAGQPASQGAEAECIDLTGTYAVAEHDSTTGAGLKFPMEYGSEVIVFEAFAGPGKLILTQEGCLLTARSENSQSGQAYNYGPEQNLLIAQGPRKASVKKYESWAKNDGSSDRQDEAVITLEKSGNILVQGKTYTKLCINLPGFASGCSEDRRQYTNRFKRIP